MAVLTQGTTQDILTLQSVAASSVVFSSDFTISGKLDGHGVYIRFGRRSATAAGAGVNIRVEISPDSSGNFWVPLTGPTSAFAACEAEAVSGTVNAGTNVVTVAATANLTAGDIIFIDNGTIANSEWHRIKSIVTNTSITLEENLANAQTGATLYDAAEIYTPIFLPAGAKRLRLVVDGSLFTQAFAVQAKLCPVDSIA